jgi:hypothetical protein
LFAGYRTRVDLCGNGPEFSHQIVSTQIILNEVERGFSCDGDKAADPENCHARSAQVVGGGAESVKEQREYVCGFEASGAAKQQSLWGKGWQCASA